jgi:hypothetical protein
MHVSVGRIGLLAVILVSVATLFVEQAAAQDPLNWERAQTVTVLPPRPKTPAPSPPAQPNATVRPRALAPSSTPDSQPSVTQGTARRVSSGAPSVAAPRHGLADGSWSGGETLQTYGALQFHLGAGGQATMNDKDGSIPGSWSQSGNSVVLRFYEGHVVYTGTLNGRTLSGTARNGRTSWTFSVSR